MYSINIINYKYFLFFARVTSSTVVPLQYIQRNMSNDVRIRCTLTLRGDFFFVFNFNRPRSTFRKRRLFLIVLTGAADDCQYII